MMKEKLLIFGAIFGLFGASACRTEVPNESNGNSNSGTVYEVTFGKDKTGIRECDELTEFLIGQARQGEESVDERAAQDYIRALIAEGKNASRIDSEEMRTINQRCIAFRSSLESKEENNPEKDAVSASDKSEEPPPLPEDNNGEPQKP